jgi:hypothetical protein
MTIRKGRSNNVSEYGISTRCQNGIKNDLQHCHQLMLYERRLGFIQMIKSLPLIKIDFFHQIDGEYIATASCYDFDEYITFPNVIEIQGRIMVKTGWNSDTHYVCFKSNGLVGSRFLKRMN